MRAVYKYRSRCRRSWLCFFGKGGRRVGRRAGCHSDRGERESCIPARVRGVALPVPKTGELPWQPAPDHGKGREWRGLPACVCILKIKQRGGASACPPRRLVHREKWGTPNIDPGEWMRWRRRRAARVHHCRHYATKIGHLPVGRDACASPTVVW
jgi:hypothetical protein